MELRSHIEHSTITMAKVGGKVKVENKEDSTGAFVWDFYLSPEEARKFGLQLTRLADELDLT